MSTLSDEQPFVRTRPHTYDTFVRAEAQRLWDVLTDPDLTPLFYRGMRVESDWKVDSPVAYKSGDGKTEIGVAGTVLAVEAPHRLVYNLAVLHEPLMWDKPPFRVFWELEQLGEACRLRVTQDDYGGNPEGTRTGWSVVLSCLKTYVETGQPLSIDLGHGHGPNQRHEPGHSHDEPHAQDHDHNHKHHQGHGHAHDYD